MDKPRISVEIDEVGDTAYVGFSDHAVVRTVHFNDAILVDLDDYGMVVGVELLTTAAAVPFDELSSQFHISAAAVELLRSIATGHQKRDVSASAGTSRVAYGSLKPAPEPPRTLISN